jgi:RNA polymerase sigma-70 factor (ECF subfamily)
MEQPNMEERQEDREEADELVRLMIAYQAGELAAFERLYAALAADLRRFFGNSLAGDPNRAGGQDLLQDTFLEVHRSRRTYLPPLPVRPWVFGIARNVLGRHRRAAWRRSHHEQGSLDAADEWKGHVPAPAGAIEPRDVADALRQLPAGRRDVWLLHHVHGFSFQQIAERFQIGADAAKLRSSRAMKSLRAALGIEKRADRKRSAE